MSGSRTWCRRASAHCAARRSARQRAGGLQVIMENAIEIEGEIKPACTLETLVLYFFET
ncbi:MAG: hypothetical protein R3F24_07270 [Gammaproteobacteria bacterium]